MSIWTRRKPISPDPHAAHATLRRSLRWPHLVGLGIGAIVGTGIYTLIGVGADRAGPAVILSFLIAGLVCACAALAYAELATLMPSAGSAYSYSYAVAGEPLAWLVGWALILEYTVVCSAVASGWSGYATGLLQSIGLPLPHALAAGPYDGGIVNLPAILIVLAVALLLIRGARESATLNGVLVAVKLLALSAFVVVALTAFDLAHFRPFMPYGFGSQPVGGETRGVMAAAAIIFFAFYGFDAVATAAEEAQDPGRDVTIGIIGSMIGCTLIYAAVAAAATGALPFMDFATSTQPLAHILQTLGHPVLALLVGAAAVVALPTVVLAFMFGQSRIFFAMARDGLLPTGLSRVDTRSGTPRAVTYATAILVSIVATLLPLSEIAELANAGTLCAFVAVAGCMLALRRRAPDLARPFRAPAAWLIGPLAIAGCVYLFISLPAATQIRCLIWNIIGIALYAAYGSRRSHLARGRPADGR